MRSNKSLTSKFSAAFSLPEVMFAMCIIAVCGVSVFAGISSGFAVIESARENLRATEIMLEKFEALRLMTYQQVWANGVAHYTNTAYYSVDGTNGIQYRLTVDVSTNLPVTTYKADLSLVTMEVSWRSGRHFRTNTMSSYVARAGLQQYVTTNHN